MVSINGHWKIYFHLYVYLFANKWTWTYICTEILLPVMQIYFQINVNKFPINFLFMNISQKTYLTVSPACFDYFKEVWLSTNKRSERTFRNRMKKPTMPDIVLFCHVCKVNIQDFVMPIQKKYKNIPVFNENLQLTID